MAKALQCPDCGNRHALDDVAHLRTFRCTECRRLLKVPTGVAGAPKSPNGDSATTGAEAEDSGASDGDDATVAETTVQEAAAEETRQLARQEKRVPPSQRGDAVRAQAEKGADDQPENQPENRPDEETPVRGSVSSPVPRALRVLIWLTAVPAGLLPVGILGRVFGVLTMDRAVDVFLGVGWSRFIPPLVLLPVWAAASATVAHLAIEAMARTRGGDETRHREPSRV